MMNKLEQAIRKTVGNGSLHSSSVEGFSAIEEIDKMKSSYLMAKEELNKLKIIYPDFKKSELVNSFREMRISITALNSKNVVMVTSINSDAGVSFFARNSIFSFLFLSSCLNSCSFITTQSTFLYFWIV